MRVYVTQAAPRQRDTIELLLVQGRRLDTHNPRRSTLGHDFVRLGLMLVDDLRAAGPATERRLDALDRVVDYRNAIGHGDEARIAAFEAAAEIKATKHSYQRHRRALEALAGTMDHIVARRLSQALGIPRPW